MTGKSDQKVVILLTIDCLRSDHLKSYGYHRNPAPNIEGFFKKGVIFSNAFSNGPETATSFSSLFTSKLPYLDGGFCPLPNQKLIFPQILCENGITNYAIHSNYYLGENLNYHRGFNTFIDGGSFFLKTKKSKTKIKERIDKLTTKELIINYFSEIIWKRLGRKVFSKVFNRLIGSVKIKSWFFNIDYFRTIFSQIDLKGFTASYIVNHLINFMKYLKSSQSYFIWAHFMDVHNPYNPPPKYLSKFINKNINSTERKFLNYNFFFNPQHFKVTEERINKLKSLYDGEINYVDENLRRFFNFIKNKFKKNCLVIITADHGDAFYEHKTFGHQAHLHDELIKVPLFTIEIGDVAFNKKIVELVELIDIAPTILDYFGIKNPDFFQGKSMLPLMRGEVTKHKDYVISETYQKGGYFKRDNIDGYKVFSIRTKKWKYIYDEEKKKEYLYNLERDPSEKNNIIEEKYELLKNFRNIRDNHFREVLHTNETSKIQFAIKKSKIF